MKKPYFCKIIYLICECQGPLFVNAFNMNILGFPYSFFFFSGIERRDSILNFQKLALFTKQFVGFQTNRL